VRWDFSASSGWRGLGWRLGLALAVALLFITLTGSLDGGVFVGVGQLWSRPLSVLANALPGLLLAVLLLVLSRRLLLSFGLAALLQGLLYAINALKMGNLGTPLMPDDFRMVGQLRKGGAHLLSGYLPHSPWPYLGLLLAVAAIVALLRYEPPLFPRRTRGKRLLAGSVLAVGLASLLAGLPTWAKVYDHQRLWMEPWSAASTAQHSGLVSSLMLFHLQDRASTRKADPVQALGLLRDSDPALRQRMQETPTSGSAAPDIVVVQSESFFDPRIMRGYQQQDFTPNLDRLARQGASGPLHVPTFGGGTIRTEFEVLTGLSLRYFGNIQFPYLQMHSKVVPGMVRTLRAHGYETIALHGNDPSFWNRTAAFKAIGFDRFVSRQSFPAHAPNDGKYMADRAMTDEIMTQLKDAGPPQLVFAISIEAHGPYDSSQGIDAAARDAIPVPANVQGKAKLELQNYLYHMRHADAELGRLAELLAQRERPTLLLFYGDHLPALAEAYNATGFVDGKDMLSQAGTWLLVDPRNPAQPQQQALASWMLPGKLLEQAGIHDDAYFALTQVLSPQLAPLTRAPGAPLTPEDAREQRTDNGMANVAMLQFQGQLAHLLPAAETLPSETGIAASPQRLPAAVTHGAQQ
jgi:phosphoglycerol transferase MdoB-like AlkP superfamily enzyme